MQGYYYFALVADTPSHWFLGYIPQSSASPLLAPLARGREHFVVFAKADLADPTSNTVGGPTLYLCTTDPRGSRDWRRLRGKSGLIAHS